MHEPISITIPDAVRATGRSRTSIYEALKSGELSAKKAGRRTLISYTSLKNYLDKLPDYKAGA